MGLKTVVDKMEEVANAYSEIGQFHYGKVWDVNGRIDWVYPLLLVECQPDFTGGKAQDNLKTLKKQYTFKVFLYDTYNFDEQATKDLVTKQDEVEKVFENYLGELSSKLMTIHGTFAKRDVTEGFHGWHKEHNTMLVQVYTKVIVTTPVDCTPGTFVYV